MQYTILFRSYQKHFQFSAEDLVTEMGVEEMLQFDKPTYNPQDKPKNEIIKRPYRNPTTTKNNQNN
jgi:hypothetical protein